jgi:AcrR family transcriptional regulator
VLQVASVTTSERPRGPRLTGRQSQLFDQLVALFLAEGFLDFTLDDLAARLRCSKTTLYALAPSKEQLALAVVVRFFRDAAERIEQQVAAEPDPKKRIGLYLTAVASELKPASERFHADLAAFAPTREVYERNTRYAAERVRSLIADGVRSGRFREVNAAFVGAVIAGTMVGIQRGELAAAHHLSDAEAYEELASLVLNGIASDNN